MRRRVLLEPEARYYNEMLEMGDNDVENKQHPASAKNSHRAFSKGGVVWLIPFGILVLLSAKLMYTYSYATLYDSSDPKEIHRKEGLLTVVSQYKQPVIIATLHGYLNLDGCIQDKSSDLIATVTILSGDDTLFQVGQANQIGGNWETNFHLNIQHPPSFEEGDLCYIVHWRVEYDAYENALSDYPSKTSSFRGAPTFRRAWNVADFNPSGQLAEWLVRRNHEERWIWSGHIVGDLLKDGKRSCPTTPFRERDYSIIFIGDSQPNYMCQHLIWELQSDLNTRCVQIKQTLGNETTLNAYVHALQSEESVVIFNPSGLWEAAYGSIDLFRENFQRLIDNIPSKRPKRQSYFFAPTTAVHPVNYANLTNDDRKWSMTQVRVREINNIAKKLVRNETKRRVRDTIAVRVLPTPIDALSLNMEDDPKTPSDMRHFGNHTNEMLLEAILCDLS
jgi:hypothetical protein